VAPAPAGPRFPHGAGTFGKTIADFRKDNAQAIRGVCREFIGYCRQLRLFGGELIAIDGSKFKAVNARHRNFSARKLKN
jgi:transposase